MSGQVIALGVPVRDVEVLAVVGSTVLATAITDRDGRYQFAALERIAADGQRVTRELLHRAAARELESMGKLAFTPSARSR